MVAGLKPGVGAALEALSEAHTRPAEDPRDRESGDGRQLGFFAAPADDETKATEIELAAKGAGRPPGSGNRRSHALADYLAALGHKPPWLTLSELQNQTPAELAKALGIKVSEAAAIIVSAADKLLPYVASKMPVAIDLGDDGDERPMILIGSMRVGARPGAPAGAMGLDDEIEETVGVAGDADAGVAR